jgi:hypothetical protein
LPHGIDKLVPSCYPRRHGSCRDKHRRKGARLGHRLFLSLIDDDVHIRQLGKHFLVITDDQHISALLLPEFLHRLHRFSRRTRTADGDKQRLLTG